MSRQKMDGLTQKAIKEHHLKEIYLHVLKSGGLSRAQLRREMNLSFPSVSALVDELISCGILAEGELIETTERGRPSTKLRLGRQIFAIPFAAMEHDGYRCSLFDHRGEVLQRVFLPFEGGAPEENGRRRPSMDALCRPLQKWIGDCARQHRLLPLQLSVYGSYDVEGVLKDSALRLHTPPAFLETLEEALGIPVQSHNKSDLCAYGEKVCQNMTEDFAFLFIGHGAGAGIIQDGRIYSEGRLRAGEIGHISVDYRGRDCVCGGKGCLEAYIGRSALEQDAGMPFEKLAEEYRKGNPQLRAMIKEKTELLAVAISNMLAMRPLDHVIIGGDIEQLGDAFLEEMRETAKTVGFRRLTNRRLRFASDMKQTEELGAVWNYLENHLEIEDLIGKEETE